jgi:hypothetical protein
VGRIRGATAHAERALPQVRAVRPLLTAGRMLVNPQGVVDGGVLHVSRKLFLRAATTRCDDAWARLVA